MSSAAPTSRTSESATSPTTRLLRNRCRDRPALAPRAPESRSVSLRFGFDDWSAGTMPNSSPVTTATAAVKSSTCPSMVKRIQNGMPFRMLALIHCSSAYANATPSVAPPSATSTLSVRSWRITRHASAPRATRTAISFDRAVARASSRLATLAHAMRSTKPTAAIMMSRTGRMLPTWKSRRLCTSTPQPVFDCGYCVSSVAAMRRRSVCTWSLVTLGLSRPITCHEWFPRFFVGSICMVVQARAELGNSKSGGITPMIVFFTPSTRISFPMTSARPANRSCQSRSLRMITSGAPTRSSSSRKSRPSAGAMPSVRNIVHDTLPPGTYSAPPSLARLNEVPV